MQINSLEHRTPIEAFFQALDREKKFRLFHALTKNELIK